MSIKDAILRAYVRLKKIDACKIYTGEEKQRIISEMIASNRKQDRDVTTCGQKLIKSLEITEVALPTCSAWFVKKEGNQKDKVIYYIHGGGFVGACTKERMSFVSYVVNKFHYNVFSIDYRLAPEFPYPSALMDCLDGYKHLLERYSAKNILLVGESAGANLVVTLSMLLRDKEMPLPCGVYANSIPSQFVEYTESYNKFSLKRDFIVVRGIIENTSGVYFEEENVKNPYVSPLFGDMTGLPPILLTASECECLLDDSIMLYQKLKAAGSDAELKTYKDLCHGFIISPQMKPVVKRAYPDLEKFIVSHIEN